MDSARHVAFARAMRKLSVWSAHKQKTTSGITMNVHVFTSVSVKVGGEREHGYSLGPQFLRCVISEVFKH